MSDDELPPPPGGAPSMLYLIKQVELAARSHLDALVAPHGITALQYTALSVLARNPGMTGARLARNSFVRMQSAAQTVALLEERGWIVREADPTSRRQLRIQLSDKGREVLRALAEPVAALEADMLAGLDTDEVVVFARVLQHARHRLSGSHPH